MVWNTIGSNYLFKSPWNKKMQIKNTEVPHFTSLSIPPFGHCFTEMKRETETNGGQIAQ